jgi:hypothetical protein
MTVLVLYAGNSNDDATRRKVTDFFSITDPECMAGAYSTSYYEYGWAGRFKLVTIPQGAVIDSAILTVQGRNTGNNDTCKTEISGYAADDTPVFDTEANFDDMRNNHRTTAVIPWDSIPHFVVGTYYPSPELKTIIQEIISRAGWASGHSLILFWDDFANRSSSTALREAKGNDMATTSPYLTITYHVPVVPTVTTAAADGIAKD